jgi:hypothetical protein
MMAIPCCDFETFEESLNYMIKKNKFPEILIDRKKAKRCWKQGMTGYEAFMTITKEERRQVNDVIGSAWFAKHSL